MVNNYIKGIYSNASQLKACLRQTFCFSYLITKNCQIWWTKNKKLPQRQYLQESLGARNPRLIASRMRNINIYPLVAHILGLQIDSKIDRRLEVLDEILK